MYHVPWIALISAKRWRLDVLTFLIHGFDKTYKMRTFECCLAFTHLPRSFHQIQRGTPETTLYFVATLTHTGRIVVSRLEHNVVISFLSFPVLLKPHLYDRIPYARHYNPRFVYFEPTF
jgi:hypothetical protein